MCTFMGIHFVHVRQFLDNQPKTTVPVCVSGVLELRRGMIDLIGYQSLHNLTLLSPPQQGTCYISSRLRSECKLSSISCPWHSPSSP